MLFAIPLLVLVVVLFIKQVKIVPQKTAFIVERLGKYHATLNAGLHILVPFIDRVAYVHTMKEQAIDVPSQTCITRDNVAVEVDGILYMQVMDPEKASYGINNYSFATAQLAQTTMRSVIGKLELDRTFEERENINAQVVTAVDSASDPWGIKVTRYEIKNIVPPQSVKEAMEKQMRAEREKRAVIAESEGLRQATINEAEAKRRELELRSEGEKIRRINEAAGKASEITQVADATAAGLRSIASAITNDGGNEAVNLRLAEQYISEFGKLAKQNNTMIIPAEFGDISRTLATFSKIVKEVKPATGFGPASDSKSVPEVKSTIATQATTESELV